MRAFKTRVFAKWAEGEGLANDALASAVAEMNKGLIDARLGGEVVKKRLALPGRGKRGGVRILVAFRQNDKAFFVYGFAKNRRANINDKELQALKSLARVLLNYTPTSLRQAMRAGELFELEICDDG